MGVISMWFWQRKEVWLGTSLQEFSRLRDLLAQNGIRYDYRTDDRMKFNFDRRIAGMARVFENTDCNTMYYLYVRREDFERASELIRNSGARG